MIWSSKFIDIKLKSDNLDFSQIKTKIKKHLEKYILKIIFQNVLISKLVKLLQFL